jgi:hypothetical protein
VVAVKVGVGEGMIVEVIVEVIVEAIVEVKVGIIVAAWVCSWLMTVTGAGRQALRTSIPTNRHASRMSRLILDKRMIMPISLLSGLYPFGNFRGIPF